MHGSKSAVQTPVPNHSDHAGGKTYSCPSDAKETTVPDYCVPATGGCHQSTPGAPPQTRQQKLEQTDAVYPAGSSTGTWSQGEGRKGFSKEDCALKKKVLTE